MFMKMLSIIGPALRLLLINFLIFILLLEIVLQIFSYINQHWHIVPEPPGSEADITILCLGDSNVYGLFLEEREKAWCSVLPKIWQNTGSVELRTINMGWPGIASPRVAEQVREMMTQFDPDYVFIMLGANDYWSSFSPIRKNKFFENVFLQLNKHSKIYRLFQLIAADDPIESEPDNSVYEIYRGLLEIDNVEGAAYFFQEKFGNGISIVKNGNEYLVYRDGVYRTSFSEFFVKFKEVFENTPDVYAQFFVSLGYGIEDILRLGDAEIEVGGVNYSFGVNFHRDIPSNGDESLKISFPYLKKVIENHGAKMVWVGYPTMEGIYGKANKKVEQLSLFHGVTWLDTWQKLSVHCAGELCENYLYPDQHPKVSGHRWVAEQIMEYLKNNLGKTVRLKGVSRVAR